jgi:hypothetical protein
MDCGLIEPLNNVTFVSENINYKTQIDSPIIMTEDTEESSIHMTNSTNFQQNFKSFQGQYIGAMRICLIANGAKNLVTFFKLNKLVCEYRLCN